MTLLEVIDTARILLGEPLASTRTFPDNTSSFWTDSQLMTFHNLIQGEVEQRIVQADEDYFVTQAYISAVAGQAEYTLPDIFIKMRRVEDNRTAENPIEIVPVGINQRGGNYPSFYANSATMFRGGYYLRGNQLVLTDTPTFTNASAIRMHFVRRLADVTAGSLSSDIPMEHHRVLVWGVVKLALFSQQSDTTLADREYANHLTRVEREIENRQTQKPRRVASAMNGRGD